MTNLLTFLLNLKISWRGALKGFFKDFLKLEIRPQFNYVLWFTIGINFVSSFVNIWVRGQKELLPWVIISFAWFGMFVLVAVLLEKTRKLFKFHIELWKANSENSIALQNIVDEYMQKSQEKEELLKQQIADLKDKLKHYE